MKEIPKFTIKILMMVLVLLNYIPFLTSQDIDQEVGNWYEKLHWWKKAKPKYQEIVVSVKRIKKLKKEFLAKHSIIISAIHDLIDSLNIDNKKLFAKINKYIAELSAKIEEDYGEDIEDTHVIDQYIENKKALEKLKQDFKLLDDLGSKVNEAVENILTAQIERAENYEEQAMVKLEELENVLDDKKAKSFYEEIQNKAENISSIEDYMQGPLKGYLNQCSIRLNQLTNEIKNVMQQLQHQKIYLSEEQQPEEVVAEEKTPQETVVKEEHPQETFSDKMSAFFHSLFNALWHIISYPFKWLMSFIV